jgi:hypothetical protein
MLHKAIIISIALLAVSLSLLALPTLRWHRHENYLTEHMEMTSMTDTSQQQLAHQVWTLSIVVACASILLRPKH